MTPDARPFPWRSLIGVLLLAGLIRGGLFARADCISRDGVHFVAFAKQLQQDPAKWMQITTKQPGFSLLLAWTHEVIGPALGGDTPVAWQTCGQLLAMISGLIVCAGVFLLSRRLFGDRISALAGVLCAFWPQGASLSADVLSDMPHLAFYLLAILCADQVIRRGRFAGAIAAGLLAAGAYWLRQEAIGLVVAIGICILLERSIRARRRVFLVTAFASCFIGGVAPYSVMVGRIMPNKNPADALDRIGRLAPFDEFPDQDPGRLRTRAVARRSAAESDCATSSPPFPRFRNRSPEFAAALPIWKLPGRMAEEWARSGRYVLAALVLAALFLKTVPRAESGGLRLAAVAIGAHIILVAARTGVYGELSSRYMIIPAALTIPWAAAALWTITHGIAAGIYNPTRPRRSAVWASALMLTLIPMLYYILRPESKNKNALRTAGLWLAGRIAPDDLVLGHARMEQLLYYAGLSWPNEARWRKTREDAKAANIESFSRRNNTRWYVDAIDVRDEEVDVSALIDQLTHAKSRTFVARRFEEPESLAAFVVEIQAAG